MEPTWGWFKRFCDTGEMPTFTIPIPIPIHWLLNANFLKIVFVKTEASDKKVSSDYVNAHLEIGIDALRELRDSGDSVKHMRFE